MTDQPPSEAELRVWLEAIEVELRALDYVQLQENAPWTVVDDAQSRTKAFREMREYIRTTAATITDLRAVKSAAERLVGVFDESSVFDLRKAGRPLDKLRAALAKINQKEPKS